LKRISFNQRFVNKTGDDLVPGKIHTIRNNYDYWKRFEGKNIALFYWEGKAYQKGSIQKVFCTKRLVFVQPLCKEYLKKPHETCFSIDGESVYLPRLAENDGLSWEEFMKWFWDYPYGTMGILHFTNFRY
jgi:hypothetical protein